MCSKQELESTFFPFLKNNYQKFLLKLSVYLKVFNCCSHILGEQITDCTENGQNVRLVCHMTTFFNQKQQKWQKWGSLFTSQRLEVAILKNAIQPSQDPLHNTTQDTHMLQLHLNRRKHKQVLICSLYMTVSKPIKMAWRKCSIIITLE